MIFVIGRCIKNEKHKFLCFEAYSSVRKFHPDSVVLIVDDNSSFSDPFQNEYKNVVFYENKFQGSGELGLYYYFYEYCKEFENSKIFENFQGVIMHDSMELRRELNETTNNVKFLWFFPNKIYDEKKDIMEIIQFLDKKEDLIKMYESPFWLGCFGISSIINYSFLKRIVEKYNFFNLFNIVKARNYRCALERVFAVICYAEIGYIDSVCGNIFLHPRAFLERPDDLRNYNLELAKYSAPFQKKWLGR